jgi:astacin
MELFRGIHEGDEMTLFGPQLEGLIISGSRYRWPKGVVSYVIDETLPGKERVTSAMQHWEEHTNIRFKERTDELDFVRFRPGNGCAAHVGMRGGEQSIMLGAGCTVGNTIHEIGHCIGLWHEQSREDRGEFIQINWDNIQPAARHNFEQHISDGDDILGYDYNSIMHYPHWAFAINPGQPTIISPQPIGQRERLSEGDIQTVNIMYPKHQVFLPFISTGGA